MAYNLQIVFSGLCLFTRENATSGGPPADRLHVLMPNTNSDCALKNPAIEAHRPVLAYDRAYSIPGETALKGVYDLKGLSGLSLDLTRFGGTLAQVPSAVVNIKPYTGTSILTGALASSNVPVQITSRLTMAAGSGIACPGAKWKLKTKSGEPACNDPGNTSLHMSHMMQWTIPGVREDPLVLQLEYLRGTGSVQPVTLHPIDNGNGPEIVLVAVNLTSADLKKLLKLRYSAGHEDRSMHEDHCHEMHATSAEHFAAYYCALEGLSCAPIPVHDVNGQQCNMLSAHRLFARESGMHLLESDRGIEMTCMLAEFN